MPEPRASQNGGGRLRVVVINDFASVTGGSDRVAFAEATGLAQRGHQVTLIAGHGEPNPDLTAAGVVVHSTSQPTTLADPNRLRAAGRGIWNRRASALVREALANQTGGPTVVHIHGFTKVLSASVVRAAIRSGIPVVATLHEYFAACPNGGFFNYQTDEICHLDPLSAQCLATHCDARAYSHKLWRASRTAVQRSVGLMPTGLRHLIIPSRSAAEILTPFLPAHADVRILANPVAARRLSPTDVAANRPFLFIGRLDHDKGPALFAQAARDARVPAVFVGAGDEAEVVKSVYPEAAVTGWVDSDVVQRTLREARALVSPALWYEVQGLAPLEAAAQGLPSVVSDLSLLRDLVDDGETGLWFRGGDAGDLAQKLARLAGDDQLTHRLGRAAYERFWSGPWDVETHLDGLEAIYASVLEG